MDLFRGQNTYTFPPPRDCQVRAIESLRDGFRNKHRNQLLVLPTGGGKCLGRDTPVLMADGTTRAVQDVRVGDQLLGPDGAARNVLSVTKGREQLYRIIPKKGMSYVCNASHILSLRKTPGSDAMTLANGERIERDEDIVNVNVEVFAASNKSARHGLKGWRAGPLEFPVQHEELLIDPYLLGCWLGDGTHSRFAISKPPSQMVEEWKASAARFGYEVVETRSGPHECPTWTIVSRDRENIYLMMLDSYGLRERKHIPHDFKIAPMPARLQLLAGMIDSDGHMSGAGYDWISKSRELAEDFAFVCRSVGLAAYVTPTRKGIRSIGFTGDYWRVSVSGDCSIIPCRDKPAPARRQKKRHLVHGIRIEPIGEGDYYGFEIDGDHLFLLGDFTVTHNTIASLMLIAESLKKGKRATFVCDRITLINQASENADAYGMQCHGIVQAEHWRRDNSLPFQIASIQTIQARGYWPDSDLVVIDEAHNLHKAHKEFLESGRAPVIGLTATPCTKGLGKYFTNVVNAATMHELTDSGVLVPMKILSCKAPDMKGAEVSNTGEWTNRAASEREAKIIGDVVAEWITHGENRKTIAFGADIAYCTQLVQRFNQAGVNAAAYTSETSDAECKELLEEFRKPDSCIRILVSVEKLAKGFDCFDAETEILTPSGWRGRGQFAAGDPVYGLNRETGRLEIVEVEGYGERPLRDGERMVAIKSQRFDIRTTEGHEFHIKYRDPKREYGHPNFLTKTAREMVERKSAYALPISAEYDFPGVPLSDDELRLIAWFMTDGSIHRQTLDICQSKHWKSEIRELLKRLALDFREYEVDSSSYANGKPAARFYIPKGTHTGALKRNGWGRYQRYLSKSVSPELLSMTREQFRVFWAELLKGDGAKQGNKAGWLWCDRKEQADAYTHLAVTRGFSASYSTQLTKKGKTMYVVSVRNSQFLATYPKSKLAAKFRFDEPVPGEIVWCIKNRLSTVITRRRGKIAIAGNCVDVGCVIDARPLRKSLSTAIQMWGRGLRSSPGKQDCILLDFTRNIVRFMPEFEDVYYNGFRTLDESEKLDSKPRDDGDYEPVGCPHCGHKPFNRRCLSCGYEKPTQALEDTTRGVMQEITIGSGKSKKVLATSEADLWRQVCGYAKAYSKPEKQEKRAKALFKNILGKWPPRDFDFYSTEPAPVTKNTRNKIKQLDWAFREGQKKAQERAAA